MNKSAPIRFLLPFCARLSAAPLVAAARTQGEDTRLRFSTPRETESP